MELSNIRLRLRSSIPPKVREAEAAERKREETAKLKRPFIKYKGKINYHTTLIDCAFACDNILKKVETAEAVEQLWVLGFDLEWPFSFQTGPGKTAVIQINPDIDTCHILHVSDLKKLPRSLNALLTHPKVRLTGVNIKNDIRKLCRDFPGFDGDRIVENCIDLSVLANSIFVFKQRWSMEKLVNFCLNMDINKDKKVRMSKWNIVPLSHHQKLYAAIDSYASLKLYFHLKEAELANKLEQETDLCDTT